MTAASTIAAVSTAPGTAGIAVIRVSGPDAGTVLARVADRDPAGGRMKARYATLCELRDPASGERLDAALALWFPGPGSFTGEDMAELHVHGGRAVVAAVLRAVLSIEGVRAAEPGEFTRRAFENGKLGLAEVEGLADLLQAETEAQRRQAYAHYRGRMQDAVAALAEPLVTVLALVEATIDFPDEGDVTAQALDEARSQARLVLAAIERQLADAERGERIRDGITVAIAGPPNAGKSTLLNALARREAAIVSPLPGTTRDSIEVHVDLGGSSAVLVDTAGLRDSDDPIESEGVARARARIAAADLTLWLEAVPQAQSFSAPAIPPRGPGALWSIRTQIDRAPAGAMADARHAISAVTGAGIDDLIQDLTRFAQERAGGEPAVLVRERHQRLFREAAQELGAALAFGQWEDQTELVAEHVRAALAALERAAGRVGTEALLDRLFATFCIGK